jgi:hypothetical protein
MSKSEKPNKKHHRCGVSPANKGKGIVANIEGAYQIDENTGCWEWLRAKSCQGYGQLRIDNRNTLAHRYMYELNVGQIPVGADLHHECRNPGCVNPEHLKVVSRSEHFAIEPPNAQLSLPEARFIRWLYHKAGYTQSRISRAFGVSQTAISNIIQEKRWKELQT